MSDREGATAFVNRALGRSSERFLHGSEESFTRTGRTQGVSPASAVSDSEAARQATAAERANVSVEPFGAKSESPSREIADLTDTAKITHLDLCMYLEERGASEETINTVQRYKINGRQLYELSLFELLKEYTDKSLSS